MICLIVPFLIKNCFVKHAVPIQFMMKISGGLLFNLVPRRAWHGRPGRSASHAVRSAREGIPTQSVGTREESITMDDHDGGVRN